MSGNNPAVIGTPYFAQQPLLRIRHSYPATRIGAMIKHQQAWLDALASAASSFDDV